MRRAATPSLTARASVLATDPVPVSGIYLDISPEPPLRSPEVEALSNSKVPGKSHPLRVQNKQEEVSMVTEVERAPLRSDLREVPAVFD